MFGCGSNISNRSVSSAEWVTIHNGSYIAVFRKAFTHEFMTVAKNVVATFSFFLTTIHDWVEPIWKIGENWPKDNGSHVPEGKSEAGAKVFKEAAVILIFMFGFVIIPIDGYGLIKKIWVSLNKSVSPQDLKEHNSYIGPIVDDILINLPQRHTDALKVENYDYDW